VVRGDDDPMHCGDAACASVDPMRCGDAVGVPMVVDGRGAGIVDRRRVAEVVWVMMGASSLSEGRECRDSGGPGELASRKGNTDSSNTT
jgi:hypothetical protein